MKKAMSLILSVAMLMTLAFTAFVVPASAEDVHTYEMLNKDWINEGLENVTINEDGTWTLTGNMSIEPTEVITLNYTVHYNIIQYFDVVGGGVKITVLDRDPNSVYEDHWINLFAQWDGREIYPEGSYNRTDSIKGVFDWCIANAGWGNTNNLFTVRGIYIEPDAGATVTLKSLAFNDGIYDYKLGSETPEFEYDTTTALCPKDADMWDQVPASGSKVNITYDADKLILGNTKGNWPCVYLDYANPIVMDEESMIQADFSVEKGAKTTIYIFFGQATCNEFDNGAYGVLHYEWSDSANEIAAGNYKGYINVVDLLPTDEAARAACYDAEGNLTISGIKLYATSATVDQVVDPAVTIRALNVLTKAPVVDEPEILYGDMNNDGKLNTTDAMLLYAAMGGKRTLTDAQKAAADFNQDSKTNMMDAVLLYKRVSGR